MDSQRPLATPHEVAAAIQQILEYHQRGKESLQQTTCVESQADELGWNVTKLRKARQFARPNSGYSHNRLDELCDLLTQHRPIFAVSHVGELVTVPWPEREQLQRDCIEQNWSLKDLRTVIKKQFGARRHGGRKRKVGPDTMLIRLADTATSWLRLLACAQKSQHGQGPALPKLSTKVRARVKAVTGPMMLLGDTVLAELAESRGDAG